MIRLAYWHISGFVVAAAVLCLGAPLAGRGSGGAVQSVELKALDGKVEITLGGEKFTEYRYKGLARPILYPISGPGGVTMTRNYPILKGVKGEADDHPHHTSLWYTHGSVNGRDFWTVGEGKGKIVQIGAAKIASDKTRGAITTRNKWVSPDGKIQCIDERTIAFQAVKGGRIIDYQITIKASNGDVTFGDTKEGTMAIRTNPVLRMDNDPRRGVTGARGKCVNSEGVKGKAIWGKRAKWVDYWAPVDGKTVGVAIFDHPSNPRHPTWWHARAYGLVTANPFGVHNFEKKPAGTGNMKIKAGQSVAFLYRFLFHEGDAKEAKIAERYKAFAKTKAIGVEINGAWKTPNLQNRVTSPPVPVPPATSRQG
ncbi:MAG: PmoA family protein [Phycisphaerae bacterium]|nr:PmoA family protein [Phycisphaerae bacterium]